MTTLTWRTGMQYASFDNAVDLPLFIGSDCANEGRIVASPGANTDLRHANVVMFHPTVLPRNASDVSDGY